jgi:hypothetical protein
MQKGGLKEDQNYCVEYSFGNNEIGSNVRMFLSPLTEKGKIQYKQKALNYIFKTVCMTGSPPPPTALRKIKLGKINEWGGLEDTHSYFTDLENNVKNIKNCPSPSYGSFVATIIASLLISVYLKNNLSNEFQGQLILKFSTYRGQKVKDGE